MINYRKNRYIPVLFRSGENGAEEYDERTKEWKKTGDAISAFYDSSDTTFISESEAMELIAMLAKYREEYLKQELRR